MDGLFGRYGEDRLLILGWHNVEGSWCFPSRVGAGRRGLEQQFRVLRRLANVVPLDLALQNLSEGRPLPARSVAITFDDGYRDTLTIAAPLLASLDLPATVFLVPGILDGQVDPWWERLAWAFTRGSVEQIEWEGERLLLGGPGGRRRGSEKVGEMLKRRNRRQRELAIEQLVDLLAPSGSYLPGEMFLDWDGARELVRQGVTIGSHSMHHPILSREPVEAQQAELGESRRLLETRLRVTVRLFCYPNGTKSDYDAATIAALDTAGYTHAVTVQSGLNSRSTPAYELHRVVMQPERGAAGLAIIARDLLLRRRDDGAEGSDGRPQNSYLAS
ncbi:MAG: polysaccharide deacetylase family protein [Egibacteraceae bacterium]